MKFSLHKRWKVSDYYFEKSKSPLMCPIFVQSGARGRFSENYSVLWITILNWQKVKLQLVIHFDQNAICIWESSLVYSRRSIIRTLRGNGKKFVISRVCYTERFMRVNWYKGKYLSGVGFSVLCGLKNGTSYPSHPIIQVSLGGLSGETLTAFVYEHFSDKVGRLRPLFK